MKAVVAPACTALHYLAKSGSALAKLALESIPDCVPLLRAAAASGLDLSYDYSSTATDVLKELGLHTEEAIAMTVCLRLRVVHHVRTVLAMIVGLAVLMQAGPIAAAGGRIPVRLLIACSMLYAF